MIDTPEILNYLNKSWEIQMFGSYLIMIDGQIYQRFVNNGNNQFFKKYFKYFTIDNLRMWCQNITCNDSIYYELFDYRKYKETSFLYKIIAKLYKKEYPVKFQIKCPNCNNKHIDKGLWKYRPHKKHLCEHCNNIWKFAEFNTVGVE